MFNCDISNQKTSKVNFRKSSKILNFPVFVLHFVEILIELNENSQSKVPALRDNEIVYKHSVIQTYNKLQKCLKITIIHNTVLCRGTGCTDTFISIRNLTILFQRRINNKLFQRYFLILSLSLKSSNHS